MYLNHWWDLVFPLLPRLNRYHLRWIQRNLQLKENHFLHNESNDPNHIFDLCNRYINLLKLVNLQSWHPSIIFIPDYNLDILFIGLENQYHCNSFTMILSRSNQEVVLSPFKTSTYILDSDLVTNTRNNLVHIVYANSV